MVRRVLLRVVYAVDGKNEERLVEAPVDLPIGRLAEVVGRAFIPVESSEASARYELYAEKERDSDKKPFAENERVGKVCVSIQPGQPLKLRLVREREPASPQPASADPTVVQGALSGVAWVLGGHALAVSGEWGVRLWDAKTQRWQQAQPVAKLPVLRLATCDRFILCALKRAQIALWEFNGNDRCWYGRANLRLRPPSDVTSLALNQEMAAVGTKHGNVYWFRVPGLEREQELQPRFGEPVHLLHWIDNQSCLQLYANAALEVWHLDRGNVRLVFETKLDAEAHVVGAATVEGTDTSWALILLAEPMMWVWVALGHTPTILKVGQLASRPVSMAYSAKSQEAWVGLADGGVQTWRVHDVGRSLELRASHKLDIPGLRSALLSHDEQYLVVVGQDNQVRPYPIHSLYSSS